jgi:hypothetical protein
MKYRTRTNRTATDKALTWDRWQQGNSLHAIAQLFYRPAIELARPIIRSTGARSLPGRDLGVLSHLLILTRPRPNTKMSNYPVS